MAEHGAGAIKAGPFDMDGVLIDATDWHYEALNDALALFGMAIPREQHLAVYDGLPTRHKLKTLTLTRGLPARLHGFINELKQRRTLELAFTHCRPKFIHQFALSRLKAEGYRLAVCSNSIRQTVDAMLGRAALDQVHRILAVQRRRHARQAEPGNLFGRHGADGRRARRLRRRRGQFQRRRGGQSGGRALPRSRLRP